jgi:two-component system chemotaxis response regulator CheB
MTEPIRVVVVDDSALMRRVITELLEQDRLIRVVGTACNGREAIDVVQKLRPDIVTMDVRMPVMDGVATTEHLMAYCPTPILVLTASLAHYDVDITFRMLGAGALEVIEKPSGNDLLALDRAGRSLIRRIKVLARVKVVTHLRGRRKTGDGRAPSQDDRMTPQKPAHRQSATAARDLVRHPVGQPPHQTAPSSAVEPDFALIVIGASTGGPRVVSQLLAQLPGDLRAAVLVVQHIAAGFSVGMTEWLAHTSKLPVRLAYEGQVLQPGQVLIAPDQRDLLMLQGGRVHLSDNPLLVQRPSIDISMQAAAEVFGPRAIGVLLTGMGRDGAYGMLTIKRANGYTIAQDEATSTIFGMPRAAIQLGAASEVLPASQIAERLVSLINTVAVRPGRGVL